MISNTQRACEMSGMPEVHANCFQQIANQEKCIIACRSVGKFATGLIMENYSSKGFHVKAKSCNWGPMAGFVLADPRFSKKGMQQDAVAKQQKDIKAAMTGHGATTMPVYISNSRIADLFGDLRCMSQISSKPTEIVVRANADGSPPMQFILRKDKTCPTSIAGANMWAVYYHPDEQPQGSAKMESFKQRNIDNNDLFPVMALVNPLGDDTLRGNYRSAMTGDYDLWGIYPLIKNYAPHGDDKRLASADSYNDGARFGAMEHAHKGNMTERVNLIHGLLNSAIHGAGYRGGYMVHHSDEIGRPFVDKVELEFIAFIPNQDNRARFVESFVDFKMFAMQAKDFGHKVTVNPGWVSQLSQYFPAALSG